MDITQVVTEGADPSVATITSLFPDGEPPHRVWSCERESVAAHVGMWAGEARRVANPRLHVIVLDHSVEQEAEQYL